MLLSKRLFYCFLLLPLLLPARPPLRATLQWYQNRPTIFLNGIPQAPLLYALTDVPGGRRSWDELPQHNLRQFYQDGIRLFQVDVALEQLWAEGKPLDLQYARQQVAGVLAACPEAGVFIRLHLTAPKWWQARHPEENTAYDGTEPGPDAPPVGLSRLMEGDPRNPSRTSLASARWTRTADSLLALFCRRFARTTEGRRVAAIQVADGVYGEWHYWGFLKWEADFGPAMTRHFRSWLARRYGTDAALQAAWQDSSARLSAAVVPDTDRRGRLGGGYMRDPQQDRPVIDYYQCQHELVANNILRYCHTIRQHWPRPVLTGVFYGYFFSCFNRQAAGGHLALQQVLASPDVDYLSGPQAYLPQAEKPGEPYRSRSLLLSVRLHGKLWLDEMDQQPRRVFPFLGGTRDQRDKYEASLAENVAQLRRNILFAHSRGTGLWLYDFGPAGMDLNKDSERSPQHGVAGYWDHPRYHEAIRQLKALFDSTLHQPYRSAADVLFVYDTEVQYHLPGTVKNPDSLSLQLIDYQTMAAYYTSAAFDVVHLDDLARLDISPYRLVVMANTFLLDTAEKRLIREKIMCEGRHVWWLGLPAYSDGQNLNVQYAADMTGMQLALLDTSLRSAVVTLLPPLGDSLRERGWGRLRPLMAVTDTTAIALGFFRDKPAVAVARKNFPVYHSWFSAIPLLQEKALRQLFLQAGVHLYTNEKAVVYAGAGFVTLHSKTDGPYTLRLRNGKTITVTLPAGGGTVLLDAETGAVKAGCLAK